MAGYYDICEGLQKVCSSLYAHFVSGAILMKIAQSQLVALLHKCTRAGK